MKKSKTRGVTLIELLVVLMLIGILSAIAIPSYYKHIKKARTAEATGNLNTIASFEEAYFNDARQYLCLESNPLTVPKSGAKGAFDPALGNWKFLGRVMPKDSKIYFQYRAWAGRFDTKTLANGLVPDLTCLAANSYTTAYPIERNMLAESDCAGTVSAKELKIPVEDRSDFFWITAISDQDNDGKCSVFIKIKDRPDIYSRDELE